VGEVVAQVVQVGPGAVGADGLAGGVRVGEGFVPGGDPQAMQQPPVAAVSGKPCGVAFAAQSRDLGQ
jgi:hypothetical protein